MVSRTLSPHLTVAEVLERWPETSPVFQRFNTACVGCSLAAFDTLEDVARIYHLDREHFLAALRARILEVRGEGE